MSLQVFGAMSLAESQFGITGAALTGSSQRFVPARSAQLGNLLPVAARAIRHYLANNYQFGTTNFSADSRVKPPMQRSDGVYCFSLRFRITAAVVVGVAAGVMPLSPLNRRWRRRFASFGVLV